ncbi:ankyrin repeat-containing domain protein [Pelagophyceae sp. CCMP2097]|nr:ankyrin repeat-containing domain protein [Pelagophyceae sp. CCMP2097]|mmetsp:Transcript_13888/g.48349  ORF Transcript_13888/g.48349 Transcript_13888/m.48349 type:complete len:248 (+) Transcript_13888:49-792(+)
MPKYRNPVPRHLRGGREHLEPDRIYCRFLCFCCSCPWPGSRRRYHEPVPPELAASRKANFRHATNAPKAQKAPRAARMVHCDSDDYAGHTHDAASMRSSAQAIPNHPRGHPPPHGGRASRSGGAIARARLLECYAGFVSGADGAGLKDDGSAALFAAAHVGDLALVEALLAEGLFLNAKGLRHETALMVAARAGHSDVCEYLFESGADMLANDAANRNAADHARFNGHHELAECLHEYGCPNIELIE